MGMLLVITFEVWVLSILSRFRTLGTCEFNGHFRHIYAFIVIVFKNMQLVNKYICSVDGCRMLIYLSCEKIFVEYFRI